MFFLKSTYFKIGYVKFKKLITNFIAIIIIIITSDNFLINLVAKLTK